MKINKLILLIGIFIVAFAVRFYDLGVIPNGLAQDETSIGYNAYSILKTGRDEYGHFYPVAFKAFGEYKLPGYIYLSVPSVAVFGTTPFAVRLPSALLGFLTVVVFFFMVRILTKKEDLAIIATLFLALNPWHIHFSRAAFEVVPALFFIVSGVYLFIRFVNSKNYLFIGLSSILFVLSVYTYNICRVFSPILFLLLAWHYMSEINYKKVNLWISNLPAFILLTPFVVTIFGTGGYSSTEGTLLFSSAQIQANLLEIRSDIFTGSPIIAKLLFNKLVLSLLEYLKNIVNYFSVSFFFVSGSGHGNHGIGNVGMFYLFEVAFFVTGVIGFIKKSEKWFSLLTFWVIAEVLVAALTRDVPQATRAFFLIPPFVILSAYGAEFLGQRVQKLKYGFLKYGIIGTGALFIGFNISYYFSSYYIRFPLLYVAAWRSEDASLIEYIRIHQGKYDHIIIDQDTGLEYTSILYDLPYSPAAFQKEVKRGPDDSEGFSAVHSFGKYRIGSIDWAHKRQLGSALIITVPRNVPRKTYVIKTFSYPVRPVVVSRGQEILIAPQKEVVYALVETK